MHIREITRLLKDNPHSTSLNLLYAEELVKQRRFGEARRILVWLIEQDPYIPKAYYLLAEVSRLWKDKILNLEQALKLTPLDKAALWALCIALKKQLNSRAMDGMRDRRSNIKKAKRVAEKLLTVSTENEKVEVYKFLAFVARKDNDVNKAIEYLERASRIYPDDAETYVELNILACEIREYNTALVAAQTAIRLLPESYNGYYAAGITLIFMGRYEKAAEYLRVAVEKNPKYNLNYTQLGKCYLSIGKYEEAEENYKTALSLLRGSRPALFGLVDIYIDTGKYGDAISLLRSLFREPGDDSELIIRTGISRLLNRTYLNFETLPNIADYFKLAKSEIGNLYAKQMTAVHSLVVRPDFETELEGWERQTTEFFVLLKDFLKLTPREDVSKRREVYSRTVDALNTANDNNPILKFFSNRWSSVENYLDGRYQILPKLVLHFHTKSNLLVNRQHKFTASIANLGIHLAKNVGLRFQKSEKFRMVQEEFSFDLVEDEQAFEVQFEPLEEGPIQLTAAVEIENYGSFKTTYDLMAFRSNPYFYGRPVQTSEMFFGRQELIEKIIARITNVVKQDLILAGMRRIGKTSLLYQLKNRLKPPFYPIIFSLQQVGELTDDVAILRQLFFQILDDLNQDEKFRVALETLELPLMNDALPKDFDLIARAFRKSYEPLAELLSKIEPGLRIVILLDEGDTLFDLKSRCQHFFRDLLQKYNTLVMVLAGSHRIRELSGHDFSSPFFNIFAKYDIGTLKKGPVFDLISRPMDAADLQVSVETQEAIYHLCAGHPHFLQAICYYLVEGVYKKRTLEIGMEQLEIAELKVLDELKESFNGIWNELSAEQKKLMSHLSSQPLPLAQARKMIGRESLEHLKQFELVSTANGMAQVTSGLIQNWTFSKYDEDAV